MTVLSSYLHVTERAQSNDDKGGQRERKRKGEHKVVKKRENESKRNSTPLLVFLYNH